MVYTVQPGDTLYSLGQRFEIDYRQIARHNRLNYPYQIKPGQRLVLWGRPKGMVTNDRPSASSDSSNKVSRSKSVNTSDANKAKLKSKYSSASSLNFIWPAKGPLTSGFGPRGKGVHDGIDIGAARGSAVWAAADGDVVYAGKKYSGYGKLIIIRHRGDMFTAYAHNQELLVQPGDAVKQGDTIAKVGSTGRVTAPHLHFEVREGARPMNPMPFLSKTKR